MADEMSNADPARNIERLLRQLLLLHCETHTAAPIASNTDVAVMFLLQHSVFARGQ